MKRYIEYIPEWTFLVGFTIVIISVMLPSGAVEMFENIKPVGISTILIAPILGAIGCLTGIFFKKKVFLVILNIILLLSFPLLMLLGSILNV